MRSKILRILIFIIVVLVILSIATMLIPVKFCLSSIPEDSNEDFYIIRYSRDKNRWLVIGDKNGLFDENLSTEHIARPLDKNFDFNKTLSVDLYMQGDATKFIVYGTATMDDDWDEKYYGDTSDAIRYTINCTGWDVLGKIDTMNALRSIFPMKYLNIYDYRWFDVLRDKLVSYLDGESNF